VGEAVRKAIIEKVHGVEHVTFRFINSMEVRSVFYPCPANGHETGNEFCMRLKLERVIAEWFFVRVHRRLRTYQA
jgi:hypothetical protein